MKRAGFASLLLLVFLSGVEAQVAREKIDFDSGWKFHFGNSSDPKKDFNFSIAPIFSKTGKAETTVIDKKFNDSTWTSVNLPHDWVVGLPFVESENFDVMAHGYKPVGGLFPESSVGWYRKNFNVNVADSGRRMTIQFDGVFRDSQVWLNGFYLGRNESGYVGFTYDITDFVDFHNSNVLVVRADASQYEGWFYEGAGIYRHVWLNKFKNVYVGNDLFIYTDVQKDAASVVLEIPVVNSSSEQSDITMVCQVADRNGKIIATSSEIKLRCDPFSENVFKQVVSLQNPTLWDVDNPYLYKAIITLKSDNKVIDQKRNRFGIRSIVVSSEKGLLVNNLPLKIKGVNCHQDHAGVGSALPDYLQYYRIRLLKEMGANAYRTSHHAPTPELLDACDSLGMLVLDETRLLNSSSEYISQFERLLLRDRNHPSVFMWSIGNEEGYVQTQSTGKRVALSLLQKQLSIDPTRSSTYAADLGNVFCGINEVIPVRGFNYREKFVVAYHLSHPQQPVFGTEMGSTVTTRGIYSTDSLRGYLPDQDITAPWWASTAEAWWPTSATNDWYMGGFVWTGFDYRGEPTPFKWPNINSHFGVMDVCGFPKNLYYYYKSWWSADDVIHISPHWNWPGKEGQPIDVWVNSNADEVELFLNGKTLGRKSMPRNSHLQWSVKYKKGSLEAIGYKNGKKITAKVETTDEAFRIVLAPDRKLINADGKDVTIVNVSVVDKKGREVPDAMNNISFGISSTGRIIGAGNGDPSSHEPDQFLKQNYKRSLFNGKCQLIVQSQNIEGDIELHATSPGLENASIIIKSKASYNLKISMR
jgi:beta-galactosidase